jgi:uncharacterized protein (DUF488 family)
VATVFTIGHGTRSTGELASLLRSAGVELLVDVRRFPGSKRHPHFAREALEKELPRLGVAYSWWGEQLGGRRSRAERSRHPGWRSAGFQGYADHMDGEAFREEFVRLEAIAAEKAVAVMCAETLWWRCHRRLIADALVVRGHTVIHIIGTDKQEAHSLNPAARRDENGWVVYDVGVLRPLDS